MTQTQPMQIAALLFDKDGTLFDFDATWSVWANKLLLQLADDDPVRASGLGTAIGFDFNASRFLSDSLAIAGTPDELAQALMPMCPDFTKLELMTFINDQAAAAPNVQATPLAPLLDRFAENGLRVGVATNDAEKPAYAHLDAAGVTKQFDFIAGSDSGFGAKPETGQMLAFCDAVGVRPKNCLMVGDSTHDLVAGRAAGMWTAAVLTGIAQADELNPFADVVLPDIGHLPDWLGLD